ncbi:MAG TPA: hypothetical protein VME46_07145, partial [Acidimicrobiales bacterium]|nr:hypothetical protein [Acidimicrobiales bacterium]
MRHNEAAQPHADAGATPAQLWDAIALGGEASVVAREVLVGVQERGSTVVRSVSSGFLDGEDWCEEYDYALTETLSRHAAGGRRPYRFRADVGDSSRPHADCIGLVVLAPGRVVREDPHFARLIAAALNEASTRGLTLSV